MPRLFISYAHDDAQVVQRLHAQLEFYPDVKVWRDKESLTGGEEWEARIAAEIACSDAVIPVLSPNFIAHDRYVHREVELALAELSKRGVPSFVVPVKICHEAVTHPPLQHLHVIDLAADWSAGIHKLLISTRSAPPSHEESKNPSLRVFSHIACFKVRPTDNFYFVSVANCSAAPVTITHVHYRDADLSIPVSPADRQLPRLLQPGEAWDTFIAVAAIPDQFRFSAYDKFVVRLASGDLYRSVKNDSVLPEGAVAGGPIDVERL
jgi:hypothetical protein